MANNHISNYLDYYSKLNIEPEFAILLRGPWGCGKTWFIKDFLKAKKIENLYISLNGISKIKQIEDSIFQQIHPVLSSKGMKIAGKLLKSFFKTTIKFDIDGDGVDDGSVSSTIPDMDIKSYFKNIDKRIIIFDDLERCSIPIKEIMGYINQFVEVNGLKVIILANEDQILKHKKNKKNYKLIKEKVIGKSFNVTTNFESSKIHFINQLSDNKIKKYLTESIQIEEIYSIAGYNNLRHLRQSLLDFERFIKLIPKEAWNKKGLIDHLFGIFMCISFELKKGEIVESDIINILKSLFIKEKTSSEESYKIIRDKYPLLKFRLPIGSELIRDYFIDGILDKKEVKKSIESSSYYQDENTPYWQKLFYLWDLNNDDYEKLKVKAIQLLESKSIKDKYELLHVAGILISLSNQKLIEFTTKEIMDKSIDCFIEMKKNKSFTIIKGENYPSTFSHGLEYTSLRTNEMKNLLGYAKKMKNDIIEENYPVKAKKLCDILSESVQEFNEMINITNSHVNQYYDTPIFKYVDPKYFHDIVLNLNNKDKRWVSFYMEKRYLPERFNKKLFEEVENLEEINKLLSKSLKKLKDVDKILIEMLVKSIETSIITIKSENV